MTTVSADSSCCLPVPKAEPSVLSSQPFALLIDQEVNKIVERKLATNEFDVVNWSLDSLGKTNGFLGQYYCLSVTIRTGNKSRTLKFFAKTPPPMDNPQYEFLMRFDSFNKELAAYTDVFVRLGKGKGPKWMPECYLSKKNVIMVLDDARDEGYVTPDKHVPFDVEHCVCVVRALSIFHSRSLIMDEKLRRSTGRTILDLYGHLLNEVLFVDHDERSQKFLASSIKGAYTLVDLLGGMKKEESQALKDRIGKWCKKLPWLLEPSRKLRNIICHRDVWSNNLMLKYGAAGKPVNCYIIDYQFLRYCPPSIDFTFCLYLTTDRATRDRCFEPLARIYHDSMSQELAVEGLDIEDCLPWAVFFDNCTETRKVALCYAITNLQVMLLSGQAIEDNFGGSNDLLEQILYGDKRSELVTHQCHAVPSYKSRLQEIVLEMKERLTDHPSNL